MSLLSDNLGKEDSARRHLKEHYMHAAFVLLLRHLLLVQSLLVSLRGPLRMAVLQVSDVKKYRQVQGKVRCCCCC